MAGDDVTGATTFVLEEGLDTGPVLGTLTETVRPDDTAGTLLDRLAHAGAGLLVATMDGLADGSLHAVPAARRRREPRAQAHHRGGAGAVGPAGARRRPARARLHARAPGAWTTFRGERVKIGPVRFVRLPLPPAARAPAGPPG